MNGVVSMCISGNFNPQNSIEIEMQKTFDPPLITTEAVEICPKLATTVNNVDFEV